MKFKSQIQLEPWKSCHVQRETSGRDYFQAWHLSNSWRVSSLMLLWIEFLLWNNDIHGYCTVQFCAFGIQNQTCSKEFKTTYLKKKSYFRLVHQSPGPQNTEFCHLRALTSCYISRNYGLLLVTALPFQANLKEGRKQRSFRLRKQQ